MLGVEPARVDLFEVNLREPEVTPHRWDAARLDDIRERLRLSIRSMKAYLADPAFFDVPLEGLLSDEFAATRRALIGETAGTSPVAPGDPYPFESGHGAGQASVTETRAGTTTHITTADRWGNVVAYTFTIESTGGAGLVVGGVALIALG